MEGGLRVPPLVPSFLRGPHESRQTGKSRAAYTDQTLARAITQGVDAAGSRFIPVCLAITSLIIRQLPLLRI